MTPIFILELFHQERAFLRICEYGEQYAGSELLTEVQIKEAKEEAQKKTEERQAAQVQKSMFDKVGPQFHLLHLERITSG